MQMRASGASGFSYPSNELTLANTLTFFHEDLAEVDVDCAHAKAVIDLDCLASKEHPFMGERHEPI